MAVETNIPKDLFFSQAKVIEGVLREAVRQALLAHKRAGNPIVVWKDGKIVWIPPDQIPVEDPLIQR